jgi:hypothetical protein
MRRQLGLLLMMAGAAVAAIGILGEVLGWSEGTPSAESRTEPSPDVTDETPVATSPQTPTETVEQFVAGLARAIRKGNEVFLLRRLHPEVIAFYGKEACSAHLADLSDPTAQFEVLSVSEPEVYRWTVDDVTTRIPDTYTVEVNRVSGGKEETAEIHIGTAGTKHAWFTDCGEPLQPAQETT